MKKGILCILLCLTLSIGLLAGCGSRPSANTDEATLTKGISQTEDSTSTEELTPTATPIPVVIPLGDPVDTTLWQEENRSEIMDFAYYLGGELSVGDGGCYSRKFDWDEDKKSVLEDYIELLCTEYEFEQVGETYNGYGMFFDVVLRYTGDNPGPDQSIEGMFSGNMGDVQIWYTTSYGDIEGYFSCDDSLIVGDDGYRHGQAEQVCTLPGDSAGAGLEYYDGVFRTTDGRLSTTLNHAAVLTDGKTTDYNAHYEISSSGDRFTVRAEDKYGNDIQVFYLPSLVGWRDGFTSSDDFVREEDYIVNDRGVRESYPAYSWKTMFTTLHNNQYVVPVLGLGGEMSGLTFRVMYMDEKVIVFYTCATFRSEPTMTEALIAVDIDVELDSEEEQDSADGASGRTCVACDGSGKCSRCRGAGRIYWTKDFERTSEFCHDCIGGGECPSCKGSGKK